MTPSTGSGEEGTTVLPLSGDAAQKKTRDSGGIKDSAVVPAEIVSECSAGVSAETVVPPPGSAKASTQVEEGEQVEPQAVPKKKGKKKNKNKKSQKAEQGKELVEEVVHTCEERKGG